MGKSGLLQQVGRALGAGFKSFRAELAQRMVASPDREDGGDEKGFTRPSRPHDELERVMAIERGRFYAYRDYHQAINECELISESLWMLAADCTSKPFEIRCRDKRAEREMTDCLERVQYFGDNRTTKMARLCGFGDHFDVVDVDYANVGTKRNLGEIYQLRMLPEYQVFRRQSPQGFFFDLKRAYEQFPEIELLSPDGSWYEEVSGRFYTGGSGQRGMLGRYSPWGYNNRSRIEHPVQVFRAEEIIHARLRRNWQTAPNGYGVGLMRSTPITYNFVMMNFQDLALARKFSAWNRTGVEFDKEAKKEAVDEFIESRSTLDKSTGERIWKDATPSDIYVMRGGKAYPIDAQNRAMEKLEDMYLFVERLLAPLGHAPIFRGFMAWRYSGELLDRMEFGYKRLCQVLNGVEEYAIVRPLLMRQLALSGKLAVDFDIVYPSLSLEDEMRRSKLEFSAVQVGVQSRRRAHKSLYGATDQEFDECMREMEKEIEQIGPPGKYQTTPEGVNKGKKGVETKDSATQRVASEYKVSR